jgi:hypothetical protein
VGKDLFTFYRDFGKADITEMQFETLINFCLQHKNFNILLMIIPHFLKLIEWLLLDAESMMLVTPCYIAHDGCHLSSTL